MDNLTTRQLSLSDLETFHNRFSHLVDILFTEYTPKTRRHMLTADYLWSKEAYRFGLQNDRKLILGAFVENELVGLLDATNYGGGIALCGWLMVDPAFQKQGVGKTLLGEFEKRVMDAGCHCAFLYASEHNIAYYEKMGYKQSGKFEKGWFGNVDYLFTKVLQEPKEENYLR